MEVNIRNVTQGVSGNICKRVQKPFCIQIREIFEEFEHNGKYYNYGPNMGN